MPTDFFSGPQLLTLTGVTAATLVITNVARHAFGWSPRWFALLVALAVSLAAWYLWSPRTPEAFTLAAINSFVVYAAATGSNEMINAAFGKPAGFRAYGERGFWDAWWMGR